MSCMRVYDLLGLHKVLGDRMDLIANCPHKYRQKIAEKRTTFDRFELVECQTCGIRFWVRIEEEDPAPDQELFIPLELVKGRIVNH